MNTSSSCNEMLLASATSTRSLPPDTEVRPHVRRAVAAFAQQFGTPGSWSRAQRNLGIGSPQDYQHCLLLLSDLSYTHGSSVPTTSHLSSARWIKQLGARHELIQQSNTCGWQMLRFFELILAALCQFFRVMGNADHIVESLRGLMSPTTLNSKKSYLRGYLAVHDVILRLCGQGWPLNRATELWLIGMP